MSDVTPPKHLWQLIFSLNTSTQNLADEHTVADGAPSELSIDALNTATPNVADKPILADGFYKKRWEFPLISE